MPRFSIRGFRSLMRDEGGNVFILFGAAVIPLVLFLGGAVDITRYNRHKTDLANALDAAALSLGRRGMDMTEAQAKVYVANHIAASGVYDDTKFWLVDYKVKKTEKGFYVVADATMKTIFLPLTSLDGKSAPLNSMHVNVDAEVVHSSNRLELALVIDNTGSMNCGATLSSSCTTNWSNPASTSRIKSVKEAAKTLVDTLMRPRPREQRPHQDRAGAVRGHGQRRVDRLQRHLAADLDRLERPGQDHLGWHQFRQVRFRRFHRHEDHRPQMAVRQAHRQRFQREMGRLRGDARRGLRALRRGPGPGGFRTAFTCRSSGRTSRTARTTTVTVTPNSYLNDNGTFTTGTGKNKKEDPAAAQKSLTKYTSITWNSGKKDTSPPYESGPNTGCPQAISPLRNAASKAAIKSSIDAMIAYPGTGTYIPTGLIWGWHLVSPGIPYTEGLKPGDQYYDKTVKAIVLFTDGDNSVTGISNHNKSYFSAFNYVARGRLGTTTSADTATDEPRHQDLRPLRERQGSEDPPLHDQLRHHVGVLADHDAELRDVG